MPKRSAVACQRSSTNSRCRSCGLVAVAESGNMPLFSSKRSVPRFRGLIVDAVGDQCDARGRFSNKPRANLTVKSVVPLVEREPRQGLLQPPESLENRHSKTCTCPCQNQPLRRRAASAASATPCARSSSIAAQSVTTTSKPQPSRKVSFKRALAQAGTPPISVKDVITV